MGFFGGLVAAFFANQEAYKDALNKKEDALFAAYKEKNNVK